MHRIYILFIRLYYNMLSMHFTNRMDVSILNLTTTVIWVEKTAMEDDDLLNVKYNKPITSTALCTTFLSACGWSTTYI